MGVAETSIASKREAWAARRKSVTPRTLSLAEQDLVTTSFLPGGGPLPLVVQPNFDGVNLIGWAAILALPSVILMMMFGQTRIFFTMSRDGLLPDVLSRVHPRFHTPHVITMLTGAVVAVCSALFPVGKLADTSNSGTLLAFAMVSIGVLILRKQQPDRPRSFRTPMAWLVCPLAVIGCVLLFVNLSMTAKVVFVVWAAIGLIVYRLYGYRRSQLAPQNAG